MENSSNGQSLDGMGTASLSHASSGIIVQAYCNSVLRQPSVDLSASENLTKYETNINDSLAKAKANSDDYLTNTQTLIKTNITNISDYFDLQSLVITQLTPGSSKQEWLDNLNALLDQSGQFKSDADSTVRKLQTLNNNIGISAADFNRIVADMNTAVNGDNGVLKKIDGQLGDLQGKIDGAIAGMALSGLTMIGGAIMIAIGAVGEIFTGGASTALIVGGVAVLAVGVGGEVGSALTFQTLNNQKNDLIRQQSSLTNEVILAQAISSGYGSLVNQAANAMTAATQMSNAWGFLSGDLNNLVKNLDKGINVESTRKLFLGGANKSIEKVQGDVTRIKDQMVGVQVHAAPKGQNIGELVVNLANQYKVAA